MASEGLHASEHPPGTRLTLAQQHELILQYTPLVRRIARNLPIQLPGLLDYEDAVGHGMCGLVEAVQRFEPGRGVAFYTYAERRIRGAMLDAFRAMDRLSRPMRQRTRDLSRAQTKLSASLGRPPTEQEVARHLGLSLHALREVADQSRSATISLDGMFGARDASDDDAPDELRELGQESDFLASLEEQETLHALATAIRQLPEREQTIVALYYVDELTMREIARIIGVSETRVSQLHHQAVRRLRAALHAANAA